MPKYFHDQILECVIKTRGLKVWQYCKYNWGNDLIYQVMPMLGKDPNNLKPAAANSIDVPNYSVSLIDED